MKQSTTAAQPDLLGTTEAERPVKTKAKRETKLAAEVAQSKGEVAVLPQTPQNFLAVIGRAASDPRVDTEKMRALLDMQKEIVAEEARVAFVEAFVAMQRKLPSINKDGRIVIVEKDRQTGRREAGGRVQQSTPYSTFENIHRIVTPILHDHGFTLSHATEPSPDGTRIIVKTFLDHIRGHQRTTAFPLPAETSGSKNNVQGWGSAFSYGKRYNTIALLNIVSHAEQDRDDDGNGSGGKKRAAARAPQEPEDEEKTITSPQQDELGEAIEKCGVSLTMVLSHFKIGDLKDLPVSRFDEAIERCKTFEKNKKNRAAG